MEPQIQRVQINNHYNLETPEMYFSLFISQIYYIIDGFDCINPVFLFQVKFSFDAIDETDLLEETLRPRVQSIGGTLEKIQLNGNHITPCIQVIQMKLIFFLELFTSMPCYRKCVRLRQQVKIGLWQMFAQSSLNVLLEFTGRSVYF